MTDPRNVAVALDGPRPPAWQARALELLAESASLRVVDVRMVSERREPLYARLHRAVEQRLFSFGPDALERADPPAATSGGTPDLLVWLAGDRPPPGGPATLVLGHGPAFEGAEPAFRRAATGGGCRSGPRGA